MNAKRVSEYWRFFILHKEVRSMREVLQVHEVAEYLGISRPLAYQLVKREGFPRLILGERRIGVPREALEKWIKSQTTTNDNLS